MPTLYAAPHACSLVAHMALECISAPFAVKFVDLAAGKQRTNGYLALNPRGKVPLLVAGNDRIMETISILAWLHRRHPEAALLPDHGSAFWPAMLSDLCWFASGVHPLLTRLMVPERIAPRACAEDVQVLARAGLNAEFSLAERRLCGRKWWGEVFSAADLYLFWLYARAGEGPFDLTPYPELAAHASRMLDRPAVRRALARERAVAPCFEHLFTHQNTTAQEQ